jgi:hypothetical protein
MDKILVFFVLGIGLSACSSLVERSNSSGYAYDPESEGRINSVDEYYADRRRLRFDEAKQELGINEGKTLSETEAANVISRADLNRLEKTLTHDAEKRQYYGYKPYFKNDAERSYFLKLPNRESRERYARQKGITTDETKFDQPTSALIESNDVGKGMSRGAVKQSWGEPDLVESAGNPMYGNERWVYNKLMSTQDGYKNERRIIYFESGRVVGWETL